MDIRWDQGVVERYHADAMVWTLRCVREGCPGVQTRLLQTDRYGPCNMCGAMR